MSSKERRDLSRVVFVGGLAAIATAVSTLLLWYLPRTYTVEPGFEGVVALHAEPAYMARLWVNYLHVFLALFAYGVVAWVLRREAPAAAAIGFVAFLMWCLAEAVGISINIWAVNETWRAAYAAADADTEPLIRASLHTFSGVWDGVFFVVLTTFLVGTTSFGAALWRGPVVQKTLSILFFLAAPLTVVIMLDGYFGASLSQWVSWSYPVLQPLSRGLMGFWLIRLALQKPQL
ncbi:MAG: hypothetical protein AAGE85_17855 [Pseudomonadota bacterium]